MNDPIGLLMLGIPAGCILGAILMTKVLHPSTGTPHHPLTPQQVAAAIEVELNPPERDHTLIDIHQPLPGDPNHDFHPYPR